MSMTTNEARAIRASVIEECGFMFTDADKLEVINRQCAIDYAAPRTPAKAEANSGKVHAGHPFHIVWPTGRWTFCQSIEGVIDRIWGEDDSHDYNAPNIWSF